MIIFLHSINQSQITHNEIDPNYQLSDDFDNNLSNSGNNSIDMDIEMDDDNDNDMEIINNKEQNNNNKLK